MSLTDVESSLFTFDEPWVGVDELRKDVLALMARHSDGSGQTDLYALASHLALLKHWRQVTVRTGLTLHTGIRDGSSSTALFKQLRHSFLLVQPSAAGPKLLIDPHFRDQFALGASTPEYRDLLSAIPPLFIGFPGTVAQLAPLMANKMSESMNSLGLPCPPWRDAEALMSLWTPANYTDDVHIPTSKQPPPTPSPFATLASQSSPDPRRQPARGSLSLAQQAAPAAGGDASSRAEAVAPSIAGAAAIAAAENSGVVVHRLCSVVPPTAASFGAASTPRPTELPQHQRASGTENARRSTAGDSGSDAPERQPHSASSSKRPFRPVCVMGFTLQSDKAGPLKESCASGMQQQQQRAPRFSFSGGDTSGDQDGQSLAERLHAAVAGSVSMSRTGSAHTVFSGTMSRAGSAQNVGQGSMTRNGSAHNVGGGTMSRAGSAHNVGGGTMSRAGSAHNVGGGTMSRTGSAYNVRRGSMSRTGSAQNVLAVHGAAAAQRVGAAC
ncbi:MAG: hypothetical protein WDW38_005705 [Sanguina aurantia]